MAKSTSVPIKKTGIKKTPASRVTTGTLIANAAPKSTFYADAEMKTAVDNLGVSTTDVQGKSSAFNDARAAYVKAGTSLEESVGTWDGCFDVLVAVGEKLFTKPDDAASCALPVAGKTKYALAMPLGVTLKQDPKKNLVRIHVERAPGMRAVSTEISTDPTNPALWKELDGDGAEHTITSPTPGNLWVRAASRTASAKSDYTAPVLLVVK